ncbi:Nn.00g076200.m01.CDS01 [Neocucurbitaria sp. VM-36]
MAQEVYHHEEKKALSFFASPLHKKTSPGHSAISSEDKNASSSNSDLEGQQKTAPYINASLRTNSNNSSTSSQPNFENIDNQLYENPAFHRHAEATTSELFYDLFFVANLTTFTYLTEINDRASLTDYIGFFSLLWLTWYQVSLYDIRFSTDSVFERIAKALHFGVMVGFAVIGPQWKPGQEHSDYKIYRAFGLILMASRFTLLTQYGVTLWYTKKYRKTVIPLVLVMSMTLVAAILYGALTPVFPRTKYNALGYAIMQPSSVYIAWYIIGLSETVLTVAVSCVWRVVSFKGTHMVQRMSLLTLIVLGEGIIVICKSISRIVRNDYLWTAPVVGQIIAAVLIIYFLYMLYFDRIQEEHFGNIKQQIWSFLHFPLHTVLVLILQGVSLLIIWRQAVESLTALEADWLPALNWLQTRDLPDNSYFAEVMNAVPDRYPTQGAAYASYINETCWGQVYRYIPKGVDASKEIKIVLDSWYVIRQGLDNYLADSNNQTAWTQFDTGLNEVISATFKTLFDTFSVTAPKRTRTSTNETTNWRATITQYYEIFDLVLTYTFIAGGLGLILTTLLGFISLPKRDHRVPIYARLAINSAAGIALCLISTVRFNDGNLYNYLGSAWIIPTICLALFVCVVLNHVTLPKRTTH